MDSCGVSIPIVTQIRCTDLGVGVKLALTSLHTTHIMCKYKCVLYVHVFICGSVHTLHIGNVRCVLCRTAHSSDAIVVYVGCMADWICDSCVCVCMCVCVCVCVCVSVLYLCVV